MNRTSTFKRIIGAAAIACTAALTPVVVLSATASSAQAAVTSKIAALPRCSTGGLDIWMNTTANSTAGSTFYSIQFTNLSGHACTIEGYPGVAPVNLNGKTVGSAATRSTSSAPTLFTLKNDGQVAATLQVTDPRNYPAANCKVAEVAGLRVYPPNQLTPRIIPFPFQTCASGATKSLSINAIVKTVSVP